MPWVSRLPNGERGLEVPLEVALAAGVQHGIANGRVAVAGEIAVVGDGELAVASLPAGLVLGEIGGTGDLYCVGVEPLLAVLGVRQRRIKLKVGGGAAGALDGSLNGDVGSPDETLNRQRDGPRHVEHELNQAPVGGPAGDSGRRTEMSDKYGELTVCGAKFPMI